MVTHNKARKAFNRLIDYCNEHWVGCEGCIFNNNGRCMMSSAGTDGFKMTKEEMNETLKRLESEKETD